VFDVREANGGGMTVFDWGKAMEQEILLQVIIMQLETMDGLRDNPDREAYCVDFDREYDRRRKRYEEITGKSWRAEDYEL
jgi:hypothetical protein